LDTQQSLDLFYHHVNTAIELYIPTTTKAKKSREDKEWVNNEVRTASKKKKQAWNKVRNDATNSEEIYENYKSVRNISNATSDRTRAAYEHTIIMASKVNPKSFWSYVKRRTKKPGDVTSLIDSNGIIISDDKEKAALLNSYFVSVFVEEPDDNFFANNSVHNVDFTMDSIDIDKDAVLRIINKLSISKAAGPDIIHARVIKECSVPFSDIFCLLFRKSLLEGVLPYQWKQANVKALFKKGSRTNCSNYRPVSLTSIICKIFETLVRDSISFHLEEHCVLTKCQHGFRSGHSCVTQLLEIIEDFSQYYDQAIPYDCIYLDFSKAFDRVPHNRLLSKVYNCGIRGVLFNWIKSFLSNRVQRVSVNGQLSSWSNVTSGIPQGSVLGPILFSIFINDLPVDIKSHIKIFADDTKIYNNVGDSQLLSEDLQCL
ncbi:MAG: reverse transcriptase family protein, partial [Reichenbachiella sp.]